MKGKQMLKHVEAIVRKVSRVMLEGGAGGVSQKEGHANFVTEADKRTQDLLERELTALLPGSVLYGEEKENRALGPGLTWVVDPIDGTYNFMRGMNHSAISVALAEDYQLLLGLVFDPFRGEMFTARAGKGTRRNGEPVRCAEVPFGRALALFGTSPYESGLVRPTFRAAEELMRKAADIRRSGSAALDLAYLACGRADIFFEYSLSPWDYAAGKILVAEAGGVFRLLDADNARLDFTKPAAVFAASKACAEQAEEIVSRWFRAGGEVQEC